MIDWKFILGKHIFHRNNEKGFRWVWNKYHVRQTHEESLEPEILKYGNMFVDIGCQIGRWTLPASRTYNIVHSFEPNPEVVKVLNKNLRMNKIKNVVVYNIALLDKLGSAKLYLYESAGQDSFHKEHLGFKTIGKSINVLTKTLDEYNLEPNLVKIDTEGSEVKILIGGYKTILKYRPKLIVETHFSEDVNIIKNMFPEYRFREVLINLPSSAVTLIGESI